MRLQSWTAHRRLSDAKSSSTLMRQFSTGSSRWIGTEVALMLQAFYHDKHVDLSPLRILKDDPGVMDYVVIAGLVRSPMGQFHAMFSTGKRWKCKHSSALRKNDTMQRRIVMPVDPFSTIRRLFPLCPHGRFAP